MKLYTHTHTGCLINKNKIYLNKSTGITIISLIVTIIVLLILAGISITTLTSDNGIIKQSKSAKENTEISEEKEIIQKAVIGAIGTDKRGNLTYEELEKQLNQNKAETTIDYTGEEFEILFKKSDRCYTVDQNGDIIDEQQLGKVDYPGDITKNNQFNGSEALPYQINCIEDLIEWSNNFNLYKSSYIKLCRNLNFKSRFSYSNSETTKYGDINEDGTIQTLIEELESGIGYGCISEFYGNFDGNNKKISNIYINSQKQVQQMGFFREIDSGTIIKNLTISGNINMTVQSFTHMGGIIGVIRNVGENGYIENCHNYANVTGTNGYVGGIVGYIQNSSKMDRISKCSNFGTITNTMKTDYAGGICANNDGATVKIEQCFNSGEVNLGSGITGNNRSYVINCYNKGNVKYGLVGANQNKTSNCYNIGVCSENYLFNSNGYTNSNVKNCFSEKIYSNKISYFGNVDNTNVIYENEYMKTSEFLKKINEDDVWIQDTCNINEGYPIFKWQIE